MISASNTYKHSDLQVLLEQSISRLDNLQQIKLLEFINSLILTTKNEPNKILKYKGCIETSELALMKKAILDCEKIDNDGW